MRIAWALMLIPAFVCVCAADARGASSSAETKTPVLSKMTNGTKRFVSGTTSMFSAKKPATVRKSGVTAIHRKSPPPEKPGFFQSLFKSEQPQQPQTVADWMKLKQIHP